MVERPEVRRMTKFYHSPPPVEWSGGVERFKFLTSTVIQQMFLEPSLSFSRFCWADLLWKLHHDSQEAYESGYSSSDVLYSIAFLQEWLTMFGLVLSDEIEAIQRGEKLTPIKPEQKIISWEELMKLVPTWQNEDKVIGLSHGALDPPHIGHTRMDLYLHKYTDVSLGGFDPNGLIRTLKGADRPRFPQLYWRMWELAGGAPALDYVFVLPLEPRDWKDEKTLDKAFMGIYGDLGIKVLMAGLGHPKMGIYRKRMEELGGCAIEGDPENIRWSSTLMMAGLTDRRIEKITFMSHERNYRKADEAKDRIRRRLSAQAWSDIERGMRL